MLLDGNLSESSISEFFCSVIDIKLRKDEVEVVLVPSDPKERDTQVKLNINENLTKRREFFLITVKEKSERNAIFISTIR